MTATAHAGPSAPAAWWEQSPCPQLVLDGRAGTVLEANDTFTRWSGLSREAVVGSEFARLLPVGDRILWSTHCLPKLEAAGRVSEVSVQVVGADGGRRAAFLTASRAAGEDGRDGEVLVALFGAAERRRYEEDLLEATRLAEASDARRAAAEADLQHLAHHDPVTGLLNRRGLETALRSQLASSASSCTVVLFIDLDGFKQVNDSVGHTGGDELLTTVAQRLVEGVRSEAAVARFAGDEFVVVLSLGDPAAVDALCDRLLRALATPTVVRGVEVVVTASIGVARCCDATAADLDAPERLTEALLHRADAAMYEVKGTGQGGWRVHDPAAVDPTESRLQLVEQLRHAIADGQLRLHHQPRVRVGDGVITGVEALVRWQHPERGLLAPGHFIELAESSGLIRDLGAWVLDAAVAQTAAWNAAGRRLQMSVNVSARQLVDPQLPALVARSLARHGVPAAQLVLEITETALMLDPETAATSLGQLRDLGTRIAVDDFGTGYASLTYLRRFPVHELKIDQTFVAGLTGDAGDRAIVAGCLQLAHSLGLVSVAEGVETPEQHLALRELGCQLAQGYLLGRPVPADELPEVIPPVG
ncbi:putative bifunctional diguanylate cyclase/phosphodiesterase [Angustibacter aerolatus]